MEVGRVSMSSVFLLCLVLSVLLFAVKDVGPQHRVSYSQYPWTFWDDLKSNLEEFNLDLLLVPTCAGGHFVPLLRKKFIKTRVAYSANHTASFNPVEVTLVRSGDIHPQPGPEKQSDSRQERHITVAHLNARSIKNRNHFILIKDVVLAKKFDILCISESWLDNSISDIELDIPGYDIHRLDRTNKLGGGVCTFVKQNLKVECLQHLSSIASSGLHQLWLKIQAGNCRSFLICTVYRPLSATLDCFDTELRDALISAMPMNKPIYILGDLNCNLLNSSDLASQALINFCASFNLTQLIRQPTRITESSATLIDVILTSHENLTTDTQVMPSSISDHDLIYVVLKIKRQRPKPVYITTRSFKNYQQDAFLRDISMVPWCIVDCFDDIDDSLYAFNTLFNDVLDKHAPIRKVRIRGRPSPYITDEIRELMTSRDRWRKIARRSSSPDAWTVYKKLRNDVKREIRSAERAFAVHQITNNPNNSSQLWKTIRSFIPKKSASMRSFSKDDRTVANDFNRFFSSVGQVAVDRINSLANECNFDLSAPAFDPRIFPVTILCTWIVMK
ncbi:uncharacterized protein [Montipora capricornis]|uniref:uncharacterized protein n=1 Tax=Montipora capricornis TaxID=246305 RepID=UPI0035F19CF3